MKDVMTRTRGLIIVVVLLVGAIIYDVMKNSRDETLPVANAEKLLTDQVAAWNRGDLTEFLKSYDMSDDITFYSDDRIARGWVSLNDRYRRRYGESTAAMGWLTFGDLETTRLSNEAAMVRGRW